MLDCSCAVCCGVGHAGGGVEDAEEALTGLSSMSLVFDDECESRDLPM